jgi:Rv2525c-like, glycoside hydrolase-like domain
VVDDIEAVNPAYLSAVDSYVQGWDTYMHQCCPTQLAGIYGSVCGSDLQAFASVHPDPDFIWGADPSSATGNTTATDLWYPPGNCGVANGYWYYSQRFRQYNSTHNETHNGTTLSVDDDCADGPIDPGDNTYSNC